MTLILLYRSPVDALTKLELGLIGVYVSNLVAVALQY